MVKVVVTAEGSGTDGEERGSSKTCATTHTETHAYYRHTQDKGER